MKKQWERKRFLTILVFWNFFSDPFNLNITLLILIFCCCCCRVDVAIVKERFQASSNVFVIFRVLADNVSRGNDFVVGQLPNVHLVNGNEARNLFWNHIFLFSLFYLILQKNEIYIAFTCSTSSLSISSTLMSFGTVCSKIKADCLTF